MGTPSGVGALGVGYVIEVTVPAHLEAPPPTGRQSQRTSSDGAEEIAIVRESEAMALMLVAPRVEVRPEQAVPDGGEVAVVALQIHRVVQHVLLRRRERQR